MAAKRVARPWLTLVSFVTLGLFGILWHHDFVLPLWARLVAMFLSGSGFRAWLHENLEWLKQENGDLDGENEHGR